MSVKELKSSNYQELQKRLAKAREELRSLRFQVASKQVKNFRQLRDKRREVAQILTFINQQKKKQNKAKVNNKDK